VSRNTTTTSWERSSGNYPSAHSRALAVGTDENGTFYGSLPTTSPQGQEIEGSQGKKWGSSGSPVTGADNLVYFGLESQCWPSNSAIGCSAAFQVNLSGSALFPSTGGKTLFNCSPRDSYRNSTVIRLWHCCCERRSRRKRRR